MPDDDYAEVQTTCQHCMQGTNFRVIEVCSKLRMSGPMYDPNNRALMLGLICTLCEGITLVKKDAFSSVMSFVVADKKKKRTTKRIA